MRFAIIALATSFAAPAFAGSSQAPSADPSVVMAPTEQAITGASPMRGVYGALSGLHASPSASFTQDDSVPSPNGNLSLKNALGLTGAVGYDYGNGLRLELELMHFGGNTDVLSFTNATSFQSNQTDGSYKLTAGMLNAWYTFGDGSIRPLVGGGVGMMHADVNMDFQAGSTPLNISGKDTVFAWQVGLGAEVPINDRMSMVVTYRHLRANGFDLADSQGTAVDVDLKTNIVTIGAMFRF
ncbi:outer membrane protein [Roseinatronobacter sp.]